MVLSLALIALSLLGLGRWSLGGGKVSGQTVPRTPPPTFTATPSVTPMQRPTETPRHTATATPRPGEPTSVPRPDVGLEMDASPLVVGPNQLVVVQVRVFNMGNGAARDVVLDLSALAPLSIQRISSDRGRYVLEPYRASLGLEQLGPGESWEVTAETAVAADAWPGRTSPVDAALRHVDGSANAQVTIHLPPALLPAAGG
jgi:hypothetical protein